MPAGTRVDNLFQKLKSQGKSVASAARIAQSVTGLALATGKPPKAAKRENAMRGGNSQSGKRYKHAVKNMMALGTQQYP